MIKLGDSNVSSRPMASGVRLQAGPGFRTVHQTNTWPTFFTRLDGSVALKAIELEMLENLSAVMVMTAHKLSRIYRKRRG